ncbi:MAG: glycosyltransferase family 4 protein [Bacteroidales bacterium]|nr:glycosyltransferase family 4 protein [Bacteroidales bacterium]
MKDKIKVLWFTSNPCSSASRNNGNVVTGGWHSSLEQAIRQDIELEIAYLSPSQKQEEFLHDGVKYYSIAPFKSFSYLAFRLKRLTMPPIRQEQPILERMCDIIEKSQPDLIHIHGTERCFGLICGRSFHDMTGNGRHGGGGSYICSSGRAIPVVISIQGLIGEITRKFFCGLGKEEIRRHESLRRKLAKQSAIRMYNEFCHRASTEREILSRAPFILGRTAWDREQTAMMNPGRKYFTVGEIMRKPFFESTWDKSGFGSRIQLVSTLSTGPYKGFENILKTASALRRHGRIDFSWTVIGYGASDEYVRISEKATGLSSMELGIQFAGRQDAGHVAEMLLDSDIYCQVSHIENSPNSLCEAMLLGMPSIATDVGGTSSMLEDGIEGMLVPDNNPEAYAEAIEKMSSDFQACKAMGESARATALVRHSPQTVRKQLTEAYTSIIGSQH